VYEALLRERMASEQEEEFDELLEEASGIEHAYTKAEKRDLLLGWGGEAVVTD
jgi:hypothetical protein